MPEAVVVVCVALLRDTPAGRQVLAARRAHPERLRGLWEFPGGKVEPGESDEQAAVREIGEELGVGAVVLGRLGPDVRRDGLVLRLLAATATGPPHAREHEEIRWLDAGDLDGVVWLPGEEPLVATVRAVLAAPG